MNLSIRNKVTTLVHEMSKFPQVECPVKHHFSPGLYMREIFMPAGSIVIGKVHKTEHFNIIMQGACYIVHDDGSHEELRAPMTFVSKGGVQKVLVITEDMIWLTTHVTEETDVQKIEAQIIEPLLLPSGDKISLPEAVNYLEKMQ